MKVAFSFSRAGLAEGGHGQRAGAERAVCTENI